MRYLTRVETEQSAVLVEGEFVFERCRGYCGADDGFCEHWRERQFRNVLSEDLVAFFRRDYFDIIIKHYDHK